MKTHDEPPSGLARLFQIGGMALKVGGSLLAHSTGNLLKGGGGIEPEVWLKNATRMMQTLAQLKGGAMKVGQMLSLQEGLFPPQVIEVLAVLQRDIKPLSFEKVEPALRELHPHYETIFNIDKVALAAASIGQVHRATLLSDNSPVVVKLQYPGVAKAMNSDFRALKTLLSPFLKLFTEMELEGIWEEIYRQLTRETDYELEVQYQRQFHERGKSDKRDGMVPEPLEVLSGRGVIVARYLPSLQGRSAIQQAPRELRNLWGENLFTIIMRQVLVHGLLHADPNLGNFGFLDDGSVVLYDFGQVKEIPREMQLHYRAIVRYALAGDLNKLQQTLYTAGMKDMKHDAPLPKDFIEDHLRVMQPVLSGETTTIDSRAGMVAELMALGQKYWDLSRRITFPAGIVFIQRTLVGLLGNIQQLGPTGNWGGLLRQILKESEGDSAN